MIGKVYTYFDMFSIAFPMICFQLLLCWNIVSDIKILLDFVPNHTSDEHPWFQKSVQNDSDYRDFFVWADPKYDINNNRLPPNNWVSKPAVKTIIC